MNAKVNVEVDISRLKKKLGPQSIRRGKQVMANQSLADMNNYVPALEHDLRNSGTVSIDGSTVLWNTPYARAQFYGFVGKGGYRVYKYTTPGTSRRWDLRAKSRYMEDWRQAFLKGAKW